MNKLTRDLLNKCKRVGYTKVAIGVCDKTMKPCRTWPFDDFNDSIFVAPDRETIDPPWSDIWKITERLGLESACGNRSQRQIKDYKRLDSGRYWLRNGKWIVVKPASSNPHTASAGRE